MASADVANTKTLKSCEGCGIEDCHFDERLLQHFSVKVCHLCKQERNLQNGLYQLLSKKKAKMEYALPDSSFESLAFLSKPNPHNERFAPLKLYLRKQVVERAVQVYGDMDSVVDEIQRRKKCQYEKAKGRVKQYLIKARKCAKDEGSHESSAVSTQTKQQRASIRTKDHQHRFENEMYDSALSSWVKTCQCGIQVQFEKW